MINSCSEIVSSDTARVILRTYRHANDKTKDPQPMEPIFNYDTNQYDVEEADASHNALFYSIPTNLVPLMLQNYQRRASGR